MTDVTFIHAEKIGFGAQARDAAIATAKMQLTALARQSVVLTARRGNDVLETSDCNHQLQSSSNTYA